MPKDIFKVKFGSQTREMAFPVAERNLRSLDMGLVASP